MFLASQILEPKLAVAYFIIDGKASIWFLCLDLCRRRSPQQSFNAAACGCSKQLLSRITLPRSRSSESRCMYVVKVESTCPGLVNL